MENLQDVMKQSGVWLLGQQDATSGGWPDRGGMQPNALNTAEAIVALIDSDTRAAGAMEIQEGVKYLLEHRLSEGEDRGAWQREIHCDDGTTVCLADLVRTSFCVQALIKAGVGVDSRATKEAIEWLIGRQNEDFGWGYAGGQPSRLMPTGFALNALLDVYEACKAECRKQIEDGLDFLIAEFCNTRPGDAKGSFGDPGPLLPVHTIYAALVLQKARRNKLSKYADEERGAIDWLLQHPDDASRLAEEPITIDPDTGRGNYGFLFMTDALLLRLLSGADDRKHRESRLARDAITKLGDRRDPATGAFFGNRVFTWSTAKSLSALAATKSLPKVQDMRGREPEVPGLRVGTPILVFVILLTIVGGFLIYSERFNLIAFLFYALLMIVCLIAFGLIGEKSFVELFKAVIRRPK